MEAFMEELIIRDAMAVVTEEDALMLMDIVGAATLQI